MRRSTATILGTALILLFVGSGCLDSDVSLVMDFMNAWAQTHKIVDKDGNPTPGTVAYVGSGGWVSTGDPTADAAIDAGQVVKSIKDADKKLSDADKALEKTPPDRKAAGDLIDSALGSRPRDQGVRSRKGAFLVESGNLAEAQQYLVVNDPQCDPAKNPTMSQGKLEQCYRMVNNEERALLSAEVRSWPHERASEGPSCAIVDQRAATLARLMNLADKAGNFALANSYMDDIYRLKSRTTKCH